MLIAALCTALPAHAGPLIIRASGPSAALFKPGKRLGETAVPLKKGDLVVVLDRRGTRHFQGPGMLDYRSLSKAAEDNYDFSDVILPDGTKAVIAATRQMGSAVPAKPKAPAFNPVPDDRIWNINLANNARHCLLAGRPVTFVRRAATKAEKLVVVRGDGKQLAVAFSARQKSWTVPAAYFARAGRYGLNFSGQRRDVVITPLVQPTGEDRLAALEVIAQGLAAAGCERQFAMLADQIAPSQL